MPAAMVYRTQIVVPVEDVNFWVYGKTTLEDFEFLHYIVIQIKEDPMAANQLVQSRIDGAIKEEASIVLAAMGLTVSDAVRLLLTKIAHDHTFPFDPLVPNATTIAAMKEARAGNLPQVTSIAALKASLDADD
jgi:DNA-damage-inducible protein J